MAHTQRVSGFEKVSETLGEKSLNGKERERVAESSTKFKSKQKQKAKVNKNRFATYRCLLGKIRRHITETTVRTDGVCVVVARLQHNEHVAGLEVEYLIIRRLVVEESVEKPVFGDAHFWNSLLFRLLRTGNRLAQWIQVDSSRSKVEQQTWRWLGGAAISRTDPVDMHTVSLVIKLYSDTVFLWKRLRACHKTR